MGTPRGQLDWVGDLESPARPPLSKLRSKLTSAMERLREAENLVFEEPFHFTQIDGLEKRITELWEEIRRAEAEAMGVAEKDLPSTNDYRSWLFRMEMMSS